MWQMWQMPNGFILTQMAEVLAGAVMVTMS